MLLRDARKIAASVHVYSPKRKHDDDAGGSLASWLARLQVIAEALCEVREMEVASYDSLKKEYSDHIDALECAIAVLKRGDAASNNPAEAPLMQIKELEFVTDNFKDMLDCYMGGCVYGLYEGGIVDSLEKLHKEFIEKRKMLEAQAHHHLHAFRVKQARLAAQTVQAQTELEEKTSRAMQERQQRRRLEAAATLTTARIM